MKNLFDLDAMKPRSIFQFLLWVFFSLTCMAYSFAVFKYAGSSILNYTLFSIAFNALLFLSLRKGFLFTELFTSGLLWLGFWFKFTMRVLFDDNNFYGSPIGRFDYSPEAFDAALTVGTCGAIGLIIIFSLRRYYFPAPTLSEMPKMPLMNLQSLYAKYRTPCLLAVVAISLSVSLGNAFLGIYQRGMVPAVNWSKFSMGMVSWLLLFGTASFYALIIDFDFESKKRPYISLSLAVIDSFLTNVSMLSRGMVFNGAALYLGALTSASARIFKIRARFVIFLFSLFALLLALSLFTVNYVRYFKFVGTNELTEAMKGAGNSYGTETTETLKTEHIKFVSSNTHSLFVHRWVGLEGAMAVSSYPELGWSLWKHAWSERNLRHGTSFYDQEIAIDSNYKKDSIKQHFITLPGIIAFLFYPGAYWFVILGMALVGLLIVGMEKAIFWVTGSPTLCSLFAMVIAVRLAHFGYAPRQTYLLLSAMTLNLIIIVALEKIASFRTENKLE